MIELKKRVEGDKSTIYVKGVLDYATMEPFNREISFIEQGTKQVVINFEGLEFIDSTGVGAIINLVHEANTKRFTVELDGISGCIHEILETIGVYEIIETLQMEEQ